MIISYASLISCSFLVASSIIFWVAPCPEIIEDVIINKKAKTLREIQDLTTAGTECRHCMFPEGDFGKIKKKIYCKDILNELKIELANG